MELETKIKELRKVMRSIKRLKLQKRKGFGFINLALNSVRLVTEIDKLQKTNK